MPSITCRGSANGRCTSRPASTSSAACSTATYRSAARTPPSSWTSWPRPPSPGWWPRGRAALLRLRHRRRAARRARRRLADLGLGPERGPARLVARRGRGRGGRRRAGCSTCSACPPDASVGFVDRRPDGELHRPRRGRHARARARGLGRRGATACPARRRCASSSASEAHATISGRCACSASAPSACARAADAQGRMRPTLCATRWRRRRAGDRLRAGGQRQHRRLRPLRRDRRRCAQRAARGCTSTAPSGSGRRPARLARTCSTGSSAPTPGRPTRTSGSTSPTTAASPSWRDPERTARAMAMQRGLPRRRGAPSATPCDCVPESSRRARGFASMRRCARWAAQRPGRAHRALLALARRMARALAAARRRRSSTTSS